MNQHLTEALQYQKQEPADEGRPGKAARGAGLHGDLGEHLIES
jgi:hypothetical protein